MNKQQQKGFTIIEVVLVLAIAGLIFLMVFIALPALQRGQRDQARRNDASAVAGALNSWRTNNRGNLPNANQINGAAFRNYVDNLSQYDLGAIRSQNNTNAEPNVNQIFVYPGARCNDAGNGVTTNGASGRMAAVQVRLESGNNTIYCTEG